MRRIFPAILNLIVCGFVVMAGLSSATANAPEWKHGIAMHGTPKYPADFEHLDYVNADAPKGGTLREGAAGTFSTLNPYAYRGTPASGLHLVTDTLMARIWDEPFSLYGLIAEAVQMPEDRSYIRFRLNPQARFHDGSPITAEDVVFSFKALRDHGRPNTRTVYGRVARVEVTEPDVVTFTMGDEADRETPLIVAMMPVLSARHWQDRDLQNTAEQPLGSGPYEITEVDMGRSITYRRIRDYWAADLPVRRGLYNFDTRRIDYYRDESIALEAFKAGAYDLRREWDATRWQNAYDIPAVDEGRIIVEQLPHGRPEWARGLIFNTRRPLFSDLNVRQALILALDFEWLNRSLYAGAYRRIESTFPNSELADGSYQAPVTDGSGLRGQRKNLRKAAAMLDKAGYEVRDGKRFDPATGRPMRFEILLSDVADQKLALAYGESLKRLGIGIDVKLAEAAQFRSRLDAFDYDVVLYRWISTLSPGAEQALYWGCAAAERPGSRNYAGACEPEIEADIARIVEVKGRDELIAAVKSLDRHIMAGRYFIPLYYLGADRVAYWDHIERPQTIPLYGMVVEAWWRKKN